MISSLVPTLLEKSNKFGGTFENCRCGGNDFIEMCAHFQLNELEEL